MGVSCRESISQSPRTHPMPYGQESALGPRRDVRRKGDRPLAWRPCFRELSQRICPGGRELQTEFGRREGFES